MTKTVLITGGAGFLGSHLCDQFIADHKVVCVDNLDTGSKRNIEHLLNDPTFTFVEHDITKDLPEAVTGEVYDVILNMACPASPPHYQRLAIETLEVGSFGVMNVIKLALRDKARFFHASTSEVYGDPEVHPQIEEYWGSVNSYGPRSMYDESKRFAEALIYAYREKHGLNSVMGRIFNTYGPRMDKLDGRVVSNFVNQALEGKDLTIYGDGKQTRSFCYVDDLVAAIVALVNSDEEGPINIGNPNEFTMLELIDVIQEVIGKKLNVSHEPMPGDDPKKRQPDISKAKERLGWEPKVQLRQGIEKTVEYFSLI